MALTEETRCRLNEAYELISKLRNDYSDVLVLLDYVTIADIANYQPDSETKPAGELLSYNELSSVLWRLGRHRLTGENSDNLLPSIIQFVLEEHQWRDHNI